MDFSRKDLLIFLFPFYRKDLLRAYILSSSRKWSIYHEYNYELDKIQTEKKKDHMVVWPMRMGPYNF